MFSVLLLTIFLTLDLTTTYNSWYDIECSESCPTDCKQSIPSMRSYFGQLIEKSNVLGHGGQGSVYACTWHGKEAAAKFIPNRGIDLEKYVGKGDKKLLDPMREKRMWQLFTMQASEFYVAREIKHPHVLRMFDFFLQHTNGVDEFVIVSERCDASLSEIEFSMASFINYFIQVTCIISGQFGPGLVSFFLKEADS